nr:hypothetical protein [Ornithinimicrobium cavernae]
MFFHAQDAGRLTDGPGTLFLRFAASRHASASAAGRYAEDEAVGRQVVAGLEAEGVTVTWNGRGGSAIMIERLHWLAKPGPLSPGGFDLQQDRTPGERGEHNHRLPGPGQP